MNPESSTRLSSYNTLAAAATAAVGGVAQHLLIFDVGTTFSDGARGFRQLGLHVGRLQETIELAALGTTVTLFGLQGRTQSGGTQYFSGTGWTVAFNSTSGRGEFAEKGAMDWTLSHLAPGTRSVPAPTRSLEHLGHRWRIPST